MTEIVQIFDSTADYLIVGVALVGAVAQRLHDARRRAHRAEHRIRDRA